MNRREHDKQIKRLCKQLNALIPVKEGEDELKRLLQEMKDAQTDYPHYNLYYDREGVLFNTNDHE